MQALTEGQAGEQSGWRILVAHRYPLLGTAISALLDASGFVPAGVASTIGQVRESFESTSPDMVLVDGSVLASGLDELRDFIETRPEMVIVLLVGPDEVAQFSRAADSGTAGLLSKSLDRQTFVDSLNLIARGERVISGDLAQVIAEEASRLSMPEEHLTGREVEVLGMVAEGLTNREIAQALDLRQNTVKTHLRNTLAKLRLRNRQQAAVYASEHGLLRKERPDEEASSETTA